MNNCYVFFVQTGSENNVCRYLNENLIENNQYTFSPKKEIIYRKAGKVSIQLKNMFPGYVFTKTDYAPLEFIKIVSSLTRQSGKIIRLLGMYNPDSMNLSSNEKGFLMKLCDEQFIVKKSTGLIIGDRVIVREGPLVGYESIIKKVDRHNQRAEIELPFMGELRQISLSLEIISKM